MERLRGVVLCRAGGNRLAFDAGQIAVIEPWSQGGRRVSHAREAYALPRQEGRLLVSGSGDGVVVDAVEVASDPPPVWAAPPMLRGGAGGALLGFLLIAGELWPLLGLQEFSRFLTAEAPAGAPA